MITQWKDLSQEQYAFLQAMGGEKQGVFVRASTLRALKGDGSAAIYLTQLIYWSQTEAARENDGWFYLTTQKVTEELGMSRFIQERVRKDLVNMGMLEYQRRGLPAKNYYRLHLDSVAERLLVVMAPPSQRESLATDRGDASNIDGGDASYIVKKQVNRPVKIYSRQGISPTGGRPAQIQKINVLGDQIDQGIKFIIRTYPLNGQGCPATEYKARQALSLLGDLPPGATDEQKLEAKAKINVLIKAIKNIRHSVDTGDLETKYVPGFEKFAGIKTYDGQEAPYVQWSLKVIAEKTRTLVV